MRIAINGFGRIGRHVLRAAIETGNQEINIVAVNDLAPIETLAHLLSFDSVHGPAGFVVSIDGDNLVVNGKHIRVCQEADPSQLPWDSLGVDLVMECTGRFVSRAAASGHLEAGAKKVLISAPGKEVDKTIVYGVNHDTLTAADKIVSNASCTTNCLAPVAKALNDAFGIQSGYMTTVHAYTADQSLADSPHKDLRRARAAAASMIPTSTGAAKALGLVLPEMTGKLDGAAIRVPTTDVSMVDLKVNLNTSVTIEQVNSALIAASDGPMGVALHTTDKPLVSVDFVHNSASSTVDLLCTQVVNGTLVRVVSWYDNEWGFANRMLDTAQAMHSA